MAWESYLPTSLSINAASQLVGLRDHNLEVRSPDLRSVRTYPLPGKPYMMDHHPEAGLLSLYSEDKIHRVVTEDGRLVAEAPGEPVTPGHVGADGALWQVLPDRVLRTTYAGEASSFPAPDGTLAAFGQPGGKSALLVSCQSSLHLQLRSQRGELEGFLMLPSRPLQQVVSEPDGSLWIAQEGQLSHVKDGQLTVVSKPVGPYALGVLEDGTALLVQPHETQKLSSRGELQKSYPDPWVAREQDGGKLREPLALRRAFQATDTGWPAFLNETALAIGQPTSLPTPGSLRPQGSFLERCEEARVSRTTLLARQAVATALQASAPVGLVLPMIVGNQPQLVAAWVDNQALQVKSSDGWTKGAASVPAPVRGISLDAQGGVAADERGNLVLLDLPQGIEPAALEAEQAAGLGRKLTESAGLGVVDGLLAHLDTYRPLQGAVDYIRTTIGQAGRERGVYQMVDAVLAAPTAGRKAWNETLFGQQGSLWREDPGMAARLALEDLEGQGREDQAALLRLTLPALNGNDWIWVMREGLEAPPPQQDPRELTLALAARFSSRVDPEKLAGWAADVMQSWKSDGRYAFRGAQALLERSLAELETDPARARSIVKDVVEPLRELVRTEGEVRALASKPLAPVVENEGSYTRIGAVRVKRRLVLPSDEAVSDGDRS